MSKSYVFWRGPDAKPHRGKDGKYAPTELLAAWGQISEINAAGKVQLQGFAWMDLEVALRMAISVVGPDGELDESSAWKIAHDAMRDEALALGGKKPIDAAAFIKRANSLAAAFFRNDPKSYILVTSLSVASFPTKVIKVGGCDISPLKSRSEFPIPRAFEKGSGEAPYQSHLTKTKYCWVQISTHGRSWREAVERALNALTLLRAIWTIGATYGRSTWTWGSGQPKPLSVVHAGPIHTLHTIDRSSVRDDYYWREKDPRDDRPLFNPGDGWTKAEKQRRFVMGRVAKLPYKADLEQILIRYVDALDRTDHDVAFLHMWTLLEKVTGTIGARYDETIKRASWFLKDRLKGQQLLESIRIQRNRYVHSSQSVDNADQAAYLIKALLEPHIAALVFNEYQVSSLAEYAEIFSLPVDVERLRAIKRHVILALRAHTPR